MANGLLDLLSPEEKAYARNQGLLGLGAGLLSGSGYSSRPTTLGQAAGSGVQNMQQLQQQAVQNALQRQMMQSRLGGVTPSAVNEFKYWQGLSKKEKEQFLRVKRSQQFLDTGAGFVAPSGVDPTQTQPVATKELPPAQRPETKKAQKVAEITGKQIAEKPQATLATGTTIDNLKLMQQSVGEIRKHAGLPRVTGPVFGRTPNLTGSATGAQSLINKLRSQTFINALQSMRNASKTGGAVGQVSDAEGKRLENSMAALEQAQTTEDYKKQLNILEEQLQKSVQRIEQAYKDTYGEDFTPQAVQTPETPPLPEGFTIR